MLAFAFLGVIIVNGSFSGIPSIAGTFLPLFCIAIFSVDSYSQSTPVPAQSPAPQSMSRGPEEAPTVIIQTEEANPQPEPTPPTDIARTSSLDPQQFRNRIERARALAAAHQLASAANELESVRKDASDEVVRNVTSVILMGIYLEDGNYARAESLLEETFSARKPKDESSLRSYFALAGQAVISARAHLARYRGFGISTNSSALPTEAISDLARLRSLLERMVAQARVISEERKTTDSLALLEDVIGIRLSAFRDAEDRVRWETEYAGAREGLASSQTQIASLGGRIVGLKPSAEVDATASDGPVVAAKAPQVEPDQKDAENASTAKDAGSEAKNESTNKDGGAEKNAKVDLKTGSPGSLNSRATKRVVPTYPSLAKSAGAAGVVRVYITVDETGKVIEVSSSEGPVTLRPNAEKAAWGWRFVPAAIGGKPLRMKGFIEFVFEL